jgi:hypothetical protein
MGVWSVCDELLAESGAECTRSIGPAPGADGRPHLRRCPGDAKLLTRASRRADHPRLQPGSLPSRCVTGFTRRASVRAGRQRRDSSPHRLLQTPRAEPCRSTGRSERRPSLKRSPPAGSVNLSRIFPFRFSVARLRPSTGRLVSARLSFIVTPVGVSSLDRPLSEETPQVPLSFRLLLRRSNAVSCPHSADSLH